MCAGAWPGTPQTTKMESFATIVSSFQRLLFVANLSILDVSGVVETLLVRLIQREPRLVSLSPRNIEIVSFKHCEKKTISFEGISPFPPLKCCSIQRHDKQRCEIALKAHKTRQLRQLRTISGNRNNKNVHRQNMVTEHITELQCYRLHTAQKVSAFGVILLRIFPHSD